MDTKIENADANRPGRLESLISACVESRWLALGLSLLAIALMVGLGSFTINRYRALQLHAYSTIGSAYIDGLLAPYALAHAGGATDVDEALRIIHSALEDPSQVKTLALLRIWLPDGSLLFSSDDGDATEDHDDSDLRLAFTGETVMRLDPADRPSSQASISFPHFEIYAPIHDPVTGATIAVGEIYQDATEIIADRAFVERMVWLAMVAATLGVLGLLALSFRQSDLLRSRLDRERRLVEQNRQLREQAEAARLDAVTANEQVLNLVGADLHDGPVQILGLMSLMGERTAALQDGTTRAELTHRVLSELRSISSGLILPELDDLDTRQVVDLVVSRHRALVAQEVEVRDGGLGTRLDLPRKTCLYRVIQEGLTNAFRHSDGQPPVLVVEERGNAIEIEIRSLLGSEEEAAREAPDKTGIGLQGMRRRLDALGGSVGLAMEDGTAVLRARIPLGKP
jgi:signal transduction histidine kinase